jgi:hypothetical protein
MTELLVLQFISKQTKVIKEMTAREDFVEMAIFVLSIGNVVAIILAWRKYRDLQLKHLL